MSMLSAQCDNLRLMARLVREYDYSEISRMLREAADTICELRNRCAELTAEQAHWELANCPGCKNVADLQEALDENARLREVSTIMLTCINSGRDRDCWECPAHKQFDDLRWFCTIRHMCAELGVEVDE